MQTRTIVALMFGSLLIPLVAAGSEGNSCSQATELECIQSTQCTLVQTQVHGKYTCHAAVGHCETGFRQSADSNIQKDCEAKPGCVFKIANCYCPANLECACGGGPPAQCVELKKSE